MPSKKAPTSKNSQKNSTTAVARKSSAELTEESPIRQKIAKKTKVKIALTAILALAVIIYIGWDVIFGGPLTQFISNREQLIESVNRLGVFGPFFYIIVQTIQIVVAPIPGQVVGSVGGFLFGGWGILWTTIGSVFGYYIVIKIARRFGRPLIEKIFKKSAVDKFDFILNGQGTALILFAIFLLPGFPDDMVCYMAGLTNLSTKKLMIIILLGRFPTIVLTNYFGAGIGGDNLAMLAGVAVISVLVIGLAIWKREWIMQKLKGETPIKKLQSKTSKEKSDNSATDDK